MTTHDVLAIDLLIDWLTTT